MDSIMLTPMQAIFHTTIRPASIQDVTHCIPLALALREEIPWMCGLPAPPMDRIERWLQALDCLYVAEQESQLIGCCGGTLETHPVYPDVPFVRECVFYVEPDHRGGWLGAQLLRQLRSWGQAHGAQLLLVGRLRRHPAGEDQRWYWLRRPV